MATSRWLRMLAAMCLLTTFVVASTASVGAAEEVDIYIEDFRFEQAHITVKAGDTVVFRSNGGAPHTVASSDGMAPNGRFGSGSLYAGDTYAVTLTQPGTYNYFCEFHGGPDGSGMAGTITVASADGNRISADDDNVARSIAWSQEHDAADTAILARADLFADALPSGGLQGLLDAPLLLTGTSGLDARVGAELDRLGVGRVIILGGTAAISAAVESQLQAGGRATERIAGNSRFSTATAVAGRYFGNATTAILARATGEGTGAFADALGAGGLAAALGAPVLFTDTAALPGDTASYLEASSIEQVFIAGGTAAVSEAVEQAVTDLGITVERIAGPSRFDTAVAMAQTALAGSAPGQVVLIDGQDADAWSSGFAAVSTLGEAGVIVLTDGNADGTGVHPRTYELTTGFFSNPRPAVTCGPLVRSDSCDLVAAAATAADLGNFDGLLAANLEPDDAADPDATLDGQMMLRATSDPTVVCYNLSVWGGASPVVAAHIHDGGPGESGPAVVNLVLSDTFQMDTGTTGCTGGLDASLVADLWANPGDYYVNYHTEANTSGATRGQVFDVDFFGGVDMSNTEEVPPVEEFSFGLALVMGNADDPEELCVAMLTIPTGQTYTAAHIHAGTRDENGPPVVTLEAPQAGVIWAHFCVTPDADTPEERAAIVADIKGGGDYYVNVHSVENPGGAHRGQLHGFHVDHATPDTV